MNKIWGPFFESRSNFTSTKTGSSSETQGQIKRTRESLNGQKNIYGTKKSKERREEPLGTMSYQISSKWSPPFWLLIGARKLVFSLVPTICPWVSEDETGSAIPRLNQSVNVSLSDNKFIFIVSLSKPLKPQS